MTASVSGNHATLVRAKAIKSKLVEIRRQIHSNPELSFQECETAKLAANLLSELGYRVTTGVAGTGVVAEIGTGRTVILRADMDALPIQEDPAMPNPSQKPGVMHACGHDVHVSCALGAAILLAESPPASGCVRFILQPAEETVNAEGKSGAMLMIEAGATEGAEAAFALHVDPRVPTGKIAVCEGSLLAAADSFDLKIRGVGTHGAYPQFGLDPILLASHAIQTLQTVISRRKSALRPAVVTIGGIKSSTYAHNIIPDQVDLRGTVRYFDESIGELLLSEIEKSCEVITALGGTYELDYKKDTPALTNDPQLTNLVRYVGKQVLGIDSVLAAGQETGADDFTFIANHMPSSYVLLGSAIDQSPRLIHTPNFDVNEDALPIGAALLTEFACRYLGP